MFRYRCQACNRLVRSKNATARCPVCLCWDRLSRVENEDAPAGRAVSLAHLPTPPVQTHRLSTRWRALFADGLPRGASILLTGEPGVGKSTLLLALFADLLAHNPNATCCYVSTEEPITHVKLRADRTGTLTPALYGFAEHDTVQILEELATLQESGRTLAAVAFDSIHRMRHADVVGLPGGTSQMLANIYPLLQFGQTTEVTTIVTAHVTKDGTLAGPRTVEHLVDVVLILDGDRERPERTLRCVKHRYGPTGATLEIALTETGFVWPP